MNNDPKKEQAQTPEDKPAQKAFVEPKLERHDTLPNVTGLTFGGDE